MAISKDKKKEILADLKEIADNANSVVFVNFHGLKVADSTQVRRKLRSEGVSFFVAKKSLMRKAFDDKKITGTMPELDGELAIAYGVDLLAPAREVFDFTKKYKDSLSILGGIFEGKYMSKEEMTSIALIPPQKTLYAMFANVINSPIQGFVMALDQIAKKKA